MRTASIVEALDQERLNKLDAKRDALSSIHESNSALRRVKKEAYFQHIYHSVGIEGNTMTLAQTRSVLETRMAINGHSVDEHNEILGLDAALKYINATLVNRYVRLTWWVLVAAHENKYVCPYFAEMTSSQSKIFWRYISAFWDTWIQLREVNFVEHRCMSAGTFHRAPVIYRH